MEGEQTEDVWGVVDSTPDTDFPDIRSKCVIHSNNGSCMTIPREGDKVRLYVQLDSKNTADPSTMRVDKGKVNLYQLFDVCACLFSFIEFIYDSWIQVARKSLYPYTIQTPAVFDWWTVYIGTSDLSDTSSLFY